MAVEVSGWHVTEKYVDPQVGVPTAIKMTWPWVTGKVAMWPRAGGSVGLQVEVEETQDVAVVPSKEENAINEDVAEVVPQDVA